MRPWLLLALFLMACGGGERVRRIAPERFIDDVELVGVEHFSEDELLAHLHLGEDSWVPFSPEFPYDEAWLPMNTRRIEALYRSAGFPDARVLGIEATPDGDDEVDLVIRVEEGTPVLVVQRTIEWVGAEALTPKERADVEAEASLANGDRFDVEKLNDSVGSMRQALRALGHPLARVRSGAEVYEDARRAEVRLTVEPGPRAVVGAIRYEGLVEIPQAGVDREVDFALGLTDTPALEARVERAVSSLEVFRWVTVRPDDVVREGKGSSVGHLRKTRTTDGGQVASAPGDPDRAVPEGTATDGSRTKAARWPPDGAAVADGDPPTSPQVDLIVQVAEAHPHTVKLGVGFTFEANRWEEWASVDYTRTNLFGNLTRLDLEVSGGWAELPDPFDPDAHGPMLEVAPTLTRKGLFEPYLTWTLRPAFEVDIEEGYQFWSPSGRLGVTRWFAGRYRLELSQNVRYVEFFDVAPDLAAEDSILGRDFRDPYFLSYAELQADAFFTDDVLSPANGVALSATYDLAGGLLLGDYDHHSVVGGARAWWAMHKRLKLAARAETGLIFLYGDEPGVPFDRKLYLGGADRVRGWGQRRLSPKLDDIPIGGLTSVMGLLQLQGRLAGPVWLVAFVDAGDVQASEFTYVFDDWNYSAGPGLRVDTPLGLVRLDVGFRLNPPGQHPGEPGWAAHFGLGETL